MNESGDRMQKDAVGITVQDRFATFLREYETPMETRSVDATNDDGPQGIREYINQLNMMKEFDATTLFVDYEHMQRHDSVLAEAVADEYYRYEPYLRRAVQEVVKEYHPDFLFNEGEMKELFVAFFNTLETKKIRDLTMKHVGRLVSFSGTVTRTSEVRPELMTGYFQCGECNSESFPVEQQFKFTEPTACKQADCKNTGTGKGKWRLDVSKSKFVDWQRVRVQENADEIPAGSMPRSVDVILRHGAVDRAKAGDRAIFTGCLVVVPDISQLYKSGSAPTAVMRPAGGRALGGSEGVNGLKALGVRDLTFRTAFVAHAVARSDDPRAVNEDTPDSDGAAGVAGQGVESVPEDKVAEFTAMANSGTIYGDLVQSVVPTIHGHDELKKGLLLMLLGGVHKSSAEGMKLRGDINVCIVGDPSTAKSQFLKYAVKFAPRAIYTSGKASSAAGLTASVAKDPDTGEFTIEAGALMLADNGICCIDEFDKMDPADQVAIHEAMEQQTISITKAGIQATLNARTSILAAANPVYGRYDRSKTLRQNLNISAPIMSRFDLFYVVLDELDEASDERIANHIVSVHQQGAAALSGSVVYSMETLQEYVKYAKGAIKPELTEEAKRAVINCYKLLRQNDSLNSSGSSYRVTVRQLESLIRLSEALARLHLDPFVQRRYVLEGYRLIKTSMLKVDHSDVPLDGLDDLLAEEGDAAAAPGVDALLGGAEVEPLDEEGGGAAGAGALPAQQRTPPKGGRGGAARGGAGTPASASRQQAAAAAAAAAPAAGGRKPTAQMPEATFHKMTMCFALALRAQEAEDAARLGRIEAGEEEEGDDERSSGVKKLENALPFGDLVAKWVEASAVAGGGAEEATEAAWARKVLKKLLRTDDQVLYYATPDEVTKPEDERWVMLSADYVVPGVD